MVGLLGQSTLTRYGLRGVYLKLKNKVMNNKLLWWGYKHTSGTYQAKRYFDRLDIQEAMESPFCEMVVGPFEAENRDEALRIVEEKTN
jgi:hypothetical protein